MLTIRNIEQIETILCHNRVLERVTKITNALGESFYSFQFPPIGNGIGWNKRTEIVLKRTAFHDGSYQIFSMGLQTVSENFILPKDIKTKDGLAWEITTILAKTKLWWETNS